MKKDYSFTIRQKQLLHILYKIINPQELDKNYIQQFLHKSSYNGEQRIKLNNIREYYSPELILYYKTNRLI